MTYKTKALPVPSLLLSRLKTHPPLSTDEFLCLQGALTHANVMSYGIETMCGCTSVFEIIDWSTRNTFGFLGRSKRRPFDIIQHNINMIKRNNNHVHRFRIDEDVSLTNSFEFNLLLLKNNAQMEKTMVHASKLNKTLERPDREMCTKTRIALGLQNLFGFKGVVFL